MGAAWKRTIRGRAAAMSLGCLMLCAAPLAALELADLESLPAGEQYRQLSLLSLVAGGIDPGLVASLQAFAPPGGNGSTATMLALEEYASPLARIVDQEMLLAGTAELLRFARQNSAEIQRRMTALARENPILISMVDVNALTADAIIIRNAIADSLEYSDFMGEAGAAGRLAAFREQTVHLRNMLEYNQFQQELTALTDAAIVDLGGRLDAYQRMFDDEVDAELMQRRVDSAEIMNQQAEDRFEEQAVSRNAELLLMLILLESQVY